MSEIRRLAHLERIAIRWGDMDAMGHVNNTVYFRYMEQARISWFDRLVPEDEAWQSTGIVIAKSASVARSHPEACKSDHGGGGLASGRACVVRQLDLRVEFGIFRYLDQEIDGVRPEPDRVESPFGWNAKGKLHLEIVKIGRNK